MLAAVLRRKTGQNVTEFLKPRLLEPLGITTLTCALLGDGTELGGGGMKMVTEDMAKFTYFSVQTGRVGRKTAASKRMVRTRLPQAD